MLFSTGRILLEDSLFLIWLTALTLAGAGTLLAVRTLRKRRAELPETILPPVSILKPLKGLDQGIRENLESFFRLDYPEWELVFSVSGENDLAAPLVRQLMAKHPHVRARLLIGDVQAGINPKVNNLVRPFAVCEHEWALISDSNTRVDPHFLRRLARQLKPGTALQYCVVAGGGACSFGGRLDAVSLNTMYARGTLLAAAASFPCVTGKAMLLRKSVLEELGGIRAFAPEVAEDFVIGQAFLRLGYGVEVSVDPVRQHVGRCSFAGYWSRTVRWGRIRKIHAPKVVFLSEPLLTSVGSGVAGAVALRMMFHANPFAVFAAHMTVWALCDGALMRGLGQKLGARNLVAWLARELLHPVQWAHIALGSKVEWRGSVLKMERSGVLENLRLDRPSQA